MWYGSPAFVSKASVAFELASAFSSIAPPIAIEKVIVINLSSPGSKWALTSCKTNSQDCEGVLKKRSGRSRAYSICPQMELVDRRVKVRVQVSRQNVKVRRQPIITVTRTVLARGQDNYIRKAVWQEMVEGPKDSFPPASSSTIG